MSDRRLVDPESWVDEYGDYLYRYAVSRLRDVTAAEEVLQETSLAGVRYQDQFSDSGSQRGWLVGILKRKIVDYIRLRNKYDRAAAYEDQVDPSEQLFDAQGNWKNGAQWSSLPAEKVESEELVQVVKGCLEHLPKGQADVFVLSVMEEMETDDICAALDISPSNLWVRLHRARLGLADCVKSKWFAGEEASHAH
jgi:RNA polymerase sigma-70 factor (TIGR02943 family)